MNKVNPVFSEVIEWKKEKFELCIFNEQDFSSLKNIMQVYGFIFNKEGKILIVKCEGKTGWSLPGGTPEYPDKNWEETLVREVYEEANVKITKIKPAFYVTSRALGKNKVHGKTGVMIRAIAGVAKIERQTIDPATGKINKRKFVYPKNFLKFCQWGSNGRNQLELALDILDRICIIEPSDRVYKIINEYKGLVQIALPDAKITLIGSFAVPMCGKEEFDLLVEVDGGIKESQEKIKKIREASFEIGPIIKEEGFCRSKKNNDLVCELHIIKKGDKKKRFYLDYIKKLRRDPLLIKKYGRLKRSLEGSSETVYKREKQRFLKENNF